MLHLAHKVRGAAVRGLDGDLGTLDDFFFEEACWGVRYLVVDCGSWLSGRRIPISPMAVRGTWYRAEIHLGLTQAQVRNSPDVLNALTALNRVQESTVLSYYGHPDYWDGAGVWGAFNTPAELAGAGQERHERAERTARQETSRARSENLAAVAVDNRLRSTTESTGYHVRAVDGEIGHVDDFLIEEDSWRIRYLVVDTSNWLGGKWVIVSTSAVHRVDIEQEVLSVGVTRDSIRNSPSFDSISSSLSPSETGPPFAFI